MLIVVFTDFPRIHAIANSARRRAPWGRHEADDNHTASLRSHPVPLHKLEVYIQSREFAAGVHRASIGDAELASTRAAKSVFLNVSEGLPDSQLGVRRRHFSAARNSLCEVAAADDPAVAIGALPAAVAGELVGRMQHLATLLAGLMR